MLIHQYEDYDDYIEWQIKTNKEKKGWRYVRASTMFLIHSKQPFAATIMCHGVRAGAEQQYFRWYYPHSHILGTEISDNATEYKMTVEWDFNKQKDEWLGKYDVIYSNSIDHSIDPVSTLETWSEQLSDVGKLYLEYSEYQSIPGGNANDPLDATNEEMRLMIKEAGMHIVEIVTDQYPSSTMRNEGLLFICAKRAGRA